MFVVIYLRFYTRVVSACGVTRLVSCFVGVGAVCERACLHALVHAGFFCIGNVHIETRIRVCP